MKHVTSQRIEHVRTWCLLPSVFIYFECHWIMWINNRIWHTQHLENIVNDAQSFSHWLFYCYMVKWFSCCLFRTISYSSQVLAHDTAYNCVPITAKTFWDMKFFNQILCSRHTDIHECWSVAFVIPPSDCCDVTFQTS